ncbi:hypothetical protein [Novosphingobium sp. Fuku2-ISO-50]|uniref:hypothetical protein n=1 Tax=Novosphingobium sp. Fuku2-ISO-50 TaxID=1739114 RepID=UPI0012E348E2|nr:hypothetical protein [Novosphingobium sp. Fuku2-ISO-50]
MVEARDEPDNQGGLDLRTGRATPQSPSKAKVAALATLRNLEANCAAQPEKLAYVRALDADQRVAIRDFLGAIEVLKQTPLDPESPLVGLNSRNWLQSSSAAGVAADMAKARDAVRAAHVATLKKPGLVELPALESGRFAIDAFHAPAGAFGWFFVGWSNAQPYPITLTLQQSGEPAPGQSVEGRLIGCSVSTGPTEQIPSASAPPAAILDFVRAVYANDQDIDRVGDGSIWRGSQDDCLNFKQVLPGFGDTAQIAGDEFAAPDDMPTEAVLMRLQSGSMLQQNRAADLITSRPDLVNPFSLPLAIAALLRQGNMLRASFWYYFWQVRSEPWARLGSPDGEAALRGSFTATLGGPINAWLGSDPHAMLEVMKRAYSYERKVPLYSGRPNGVGAGAWQNAVAAARAHYDLAAIEASFARMKDKWAAERVQNHLPNGPLLNPGKPLPDGWR